MVIIYEQYKDERFLVKCISMFKVPCNFLYAEVFFIPEKLEKKESQKIKGRTNTGKQSDSPVFRTNIIDLVVV